MKDQDLLTLARVMKERALARHRHRLAASAQVAGEIAQVDRLGRLGWAGASEARTLGADVAWRDWLGLRRADLQRQAALARAAEIESRRHAAVAFGRCEALKSLQDDAEREARRKYAMLQEEKMQALALLRDVDAAS